MPTPHACTAGPEVDKPLADILVRLGHRVVTFDPPGAFASSRKPTVGMPEMVDCAAEALDVAGVDGPIPVAGHSMASVCAIGLALEHPDRVSRLLLIGTTTGPRAALKFGGMPRCWPWWSTDFWRFIVAGLRLSLGGGNLYVQQQLCRQTVSASWFRRPAILAQPPSPSSRRRPASPRAVWASRIRTLDYSPRLPQIAVPTLVCCGRHDPQTTVEANAAVIRGIRGSALAVFEQSGHYPFLEEPEAFSTEVARFLR
jgi:proline iminopeptidase